MKVTIEDHIPLVKQSKDAAIAGALEKIGLLCEGYASALAPVDTGRLRSSITHEVDGKESVSIGSDVEYAIYQEMGTSKMAAQPFLKPAVEGHMGEYMLIVTESLISGGIGI